MNQCTSRRYERIGWSTEKLVKGHGSLAKNESHGILSHGYLLTLIMWPSETFVSCMSL